MNVSIGIKNMGFGFAFMKNAFSRNNAKGEVLNHEDIMGIRMDGHINDADVFNVLY